MESERFTCDKPCGWKKNCGRQRCSERCCPLSSSNNIPSGDWDPHFLPNGLWEEAEVRAIAKLIHPNLVRVRGFYCGDDEKLVIYDYISNGSLATSSYRKPGSSPSHLPFEVRLKIARGLARGLAYVHDKKHVHGNIKPSNVLLRPDMEPVIADLGLERLVSGNTLGASYKASSSIRQFGSQRSLREASQYLPPIASPSTPASSYAGAASPYQVPESLKNLRPNPKWDVYSFGVVLLELLSWKVFSDWELCQWTAGSARKRRITGSGKWLTCQYGVTWRDERTPCWSVSN